MFQQYTTQECEQCANLQYVRQADALSVSVEAGTPNGHVSRQISPCQRPFLLANDLLNVESHAVSRDLVQAKERASEDVTAP